MVAAKAGEIIKLPSNVTEVGYLPGQPTYAACNGNGLWMRNLTACYAIATFCTCGLKKATTLWHCDGRGVQLILPATLASFVHNGDTIVIAGGSDLSDDPTLAKTGLLAVKSKLDEILAKGRVNARTIRYEYATKQSGRNNYSFVVLADGTYGRLDLS